MATEECPRIRRIFVLKGQEPKEYCHFHGGAPADYQPPPEPEIKNGKEDEDKEEEDWDWDGWLSPPPNNKKQNRYQAQPWIPIDN